MSDSKTEGGDIADEKAEGAIPESAEPNSTKPAVDDAEIVVGTSLWKDARKRLLRNRAAVIGGCIVLLMILTALAYPLLSRFITHYELDEVHLCLRNQPPGMRGIPSTHTRFFSDEDFPFADLDTDGDGRLVALELTSAIQQLEFDHLDDNEDGFLSSQEIEDAPRAFDVQRIEDLVAQLDTDGDGRINFVESEPFTLIFPEAESSVFVRRHESESAADGGLDSAEFPGLPRPQTFVLGTDALGRDLMTRLFYGARISLLVGFLATFVSLLIGVSWGATAGYLGGRIDNLMMRIVDVLYGVPFMFIVILLMVVFGRNFYLLFIALGAVQWLTMSRIVRGQVISLKGQEFVEAARAIGVPTRRIIFRHLIPNALGPIIVYATLTVPAVMLEEAFLSFLGLGIQAPLTSWGALAQDGSAPGIMMRYPWLILAPGLALAVTLLSLNFLGDGLRDALDPKLRKK